MKLEIYDAEKAEAPILDAAMRAALRWPTAQLVCIYVDERVPADAPEHRHPGWIEYAVVIFREQHSIPMRLGVIQRQPGADIEVHS